MRPVPPLLTSDFVPLLFAGHRPKGSDAGPLATILRDPDPWEKMGKMGICLTIDAARNDAEIEKLRNWVEDERSLIVKSTSVSAKSSSVLSSGGKAGVKAGVGRKKDWTMEDLWEVLRTEVGPEAMDAEMKKELDERMRDLKKKKKATKWVEERDRLFAERNERPRLDGDEWEEVGVGGGA